MESTGKIVDPKLKAYEPHKGQSSNQLVSFAEFVCTAFGFQRINKFRIVVVLFKCTT
jgi:hypothetical protein